MDLVQCEAVVDTGEVAVVTAIEDHANESKESNVEVTPVTNNTINKLLRSFRKKISTANKIRTELFKSSPESKFSPLSNGKVTPMPADLLSTSNDLIDSEANVLTEATGRVSLYDSDHLATNSLPNVLEHECPKSTSQHLESTDLDTAELLPEQPSSASLLMQELTKLSKCGWYWGPISRGEAEDKLMDQEDGAFLVRDSSDDHYLLSLSFKSHNRAFHTRIEYSNGMFSFYSQPEGDGDASVIKLIEDSVAMSNDGIFCYSSGRSPSSQSFQVRLTKPYSRFTGQVRSLQYLCRFIIRQHTRLDHIQVLPLPSRIKEYLEEGQF
jgi:suppressor of cytokine signaling 7